MPCTPQSVLATGAAFQGFDPGNLLLARVGMLFKQNGSTGTPASLLAQGEFAFGASDLQIKTWLAAAMINTVYGVTFYLVPLSQGISYQGIGPEMQSLCQTISQWVAAGSPAIGTVLAPSKLFQELSARDLAIVELVLLCAINAVTLSVAALNSFAKEFELLGCDTGQLDIIISYLYCEL
jgi:hypothetical protein